MIGRLLDKYEILEEVGQGGMAVVYKGLDTSLKREVAVKVLHPHLASHEEARQRFEREAQAVAKLRHDNILEIYDYSGSTSNESYIVTELIRGRTLKEFIAAHPLELPELGVLIAAEICAAVEHAHALGVLHRDIKPENIMIREDGVVKLTDFGIAQILDGGRLTVTGQLLGSPAYMSPEHVEGRPLDFRTDVFSIGVLLYQLVTGDLPFKGRNPHEILKRIAECRYADPRVVNPRVGNRLAKVLGRTLAREPGDRYPDVALLVRDLKALLEEAELSDARAELRRFFADPPAATVALKPRLVATLSRRGREELGRKRVAPALELWNRVLAIEPKNEEVLRELEKLSRRRRLARAGMIAAVVVAVAGGAALLRETLDGAGGPAEPTTSASATPAPATTPTAPTPTAMAAKARPPAGPAAASPDTGPAPVVKVGREKLGNRARPPLALALPAVPAVVVSRAVRVLPDLKSVECSVDGGPFGKLIRGAVEVAVADRARRVVCRHELCDDAVVDLEPDDRAAAVPLRMEFKPTRVVPRCPAADAISVDGRVAASGAPIEITAFERNGKKQVTVDFSVAGRTATETVVVTANDPPHEVPCDAP